MRGRRAAGRATGDMRVWGWTREGDAAKEEESEETGYGFPFFIGVVC